MVSPIADMPPVLLAWDAELELIDATGRGRTVRTEDFYTGYRETVLAENEYIARINVPRAAINTFHRFYKSSKRIEDDISSVMGAFRFDQEGESLSAARVAFGGMAATPVRLKDVETILCSGPLDDALLDEAEAVLRQSMNPLSDVRASADYRLDMAASMLVRALRALRGETQPLVMEWQADA